MKSPHHATVTTCTAIGHFLLLARLSRTHCLKTSRSFQIVLLTLSNSH